MLVVEALQAIADYLATVVAQAITKTIELADELDTGTNSQNLITAIYQATSMCLT
jgi:hypothetical protein